MINSRQITEDIRTVGSLTWFGNYNEYKSKSFKFSRYTGLRSGKEVLLIELIKPKGIEKELFRSSYNSDEDVLSGIWDAALEADLKLLAQKAKTLREKEAERIKKRNWKEEQRIIKYFRKLYRAK